MTPPRSFDIIQLMVNGIGNMTSIRFPLDENATNFQRGRRGHDPALRTDSLSIVPKGLLNCQLIKEVRRCKPIFPD